MMNTTLEHSVQEITEERKSLRTVMGGSLAEGVLSGIVVVLSLIGLAGAMPYAVLSVTTIVLGIALLLEGAAISTRFSRLLAEARKTRADDEARIGMGMTSEFVAGMAGIVLGILGLLKISPMILIPTAVIAFGGTLILSSGLTLRLDTAELDLYTESTRFKRIAHEAMVAAIGVEILLGFSAVVLGIIALTSPYSLYSATLSLVAMLLIGVTGLISGAAITARMASLFRKEQPVKT